MNIISCIFVSTTHFLRGSHSASISGIFLPYYIKLRGINLPKGHLLVNSLNVCRYRLVPFFMHLLQQHFLTLKY